jgi:hypothetical protein
VQAADFYLLYMARGENLPPLTNQDAGRARVSVLWFNTFATSAERAKLLPAVAGQEPTSSGERKRVVMHLQKLVKKRLIAAFVGVNQKIPPALIKPGLLVGGVDSRVTELSKLKPVGVSLKANLDDFSEFRRREEAVEHEPGSSGGGDESGAGLTGGGAGTGPEVGPGVAAEAGVGTWTGDGPVAAAETEGAGSHDKRQRSEVRGESEDSAAANPRANWGAWLMRRGGGSGKSQAL